MLCVGVCGMQCKSCTNGLSEIEEQFEQCFYCQREEEKERDKENVDKK